MGSSFKDHLRLDSGQRKKILRQLDQMPSRMTDASRRNFPRWDYRALDIAMNVVHPGGGRSRFLVCSRNLSAGGLSFLHGGYLHSGSECSLVLMRRDGTPLALAGTIRHCRHLQGSCHEIGVQFASEIDPETILLPSDLDDAEDLAKLDQSMLVPTFVGNLLLVDDSASDRRLLAHQLSATGLNVVAVETSGAALDALKLRRIDIVICGLNEAGGIGVYAVEQIREIGFRQPVVVFMPEIGGTELCEIRHAGATEVVGKT